MDKGKKNMLVILSIVVVVLVAFGAWMMISSKQASIPADEFDAMYVAYGENNEEYVFISDTHGVFTVIFPDNMYGLDGTVIQGSDLKTGNIVRIYGNGLMLESYPAQYPGVDKIELIEEGSPSDADQYQSIIDGIYTKPDPAEPPTLNISYGSDYGATSVMINRGGYKWSYEDEEGNSVTALADSLNVLHWGDDILATVNLTKETDLDLIFSKLPDKVVVYRYPSSLRGSEEQVEGERVEVEREDGGTSYEIDDVSGDYVYEVTAYWDNSEVTYGFVTVMK
jgi:hypothetical protein